MDLGADIARERGYPYWKSLTTGKSVSLGNAEEMRDKLSTISCSSHPRCLDRRRGASWYLRNDHHQCAYLCDRAAAGAWGGQLKLEKYSNDVPYMSVAGSFYMPARWDLMFVFVTKDECNITKFQTGGPDGDLGSNEILMSKDKTIASRQTGSFLKVCS